jgi:hypothetical protein
LKSSAMKNAAWWQKQQKQLVLGEGLEKTSNKV